MPSTLAEQRRLVNRRWRLRRLRRGLCEKCPSTRRPGKTTCEACAKADSRRRVDYQRRQGAVPRYADRRGYRVRGRPAVAPRLSAPPTGCPKCRGCVVDLSVEWHCLNCGWSGWRAA